VLKKSSSDRSAVYKTKTPKNQAKALHPEELLVRRAAWYSKEEASFIDALAAVRGELWWRGEENYEESSGSPDLVLIPRPLWDSVRETLCYAA
jgi:hypothetical protein